MTKVPVFLIGYMGCGKSSVGRKLARRLGVAFADTDAMVEEQEGAAVADIFQYEGPERFRELEREALERAIGLGGDVVISTGGGLPIWSDNMTRMNAVGITVYLRRTPRQIASRLSPYGRQKRPMLRGLDDAELVAFMTRHMAEREPFYMQAQLTFDCTEISDSELLERILEKVKEINS